MNKEDSNQLIAEKISDIATVCMLINLESDLCVFFRISAHINEVRVTVAESKENYNNDVSSFESYYDINEKMDIGLETEDVMDNLNKILTKLEIILKEVRGK